MELVPLCDGAATQNCMKSMFRWPNFDCFHVLSVEVRQKHECVIDFIFPLEHRFRSALCVCLCVIMFWFGKQVPDMIHACVYCVAVSPCFHVWMLG